MTQGFQQHLTHWPSSYSISLKASRGGPQPTPTQTAQRRGATQGPSQENMPGSSLLRAARGGCPGNGTVHSTKKEKRMTVQSGRTFGQSRKEANWSVAAQQTRVRAQLLHPSGCGDVRSRLTSLRLSVFIYTVETVIPCLHRIAVKIKGEQCT